MMFPFPSSLPLQILKTKRGGSPSPSRSPSKKKARWIVPAAAEQLKEKQDELTETKKRLVEIDDKLRGLNEERFVVLLPSKIRDLWC